MYDFLSECLSEIDLNISEENKNKLLKYMSLVLEENKYHNLTSVTDEKDFIIKHITDSLTVAKYIPDTKINIIDIGSGAGFPAVPIRIVKENPFITIIDSTKKKTDFIDITVKKLGIDSNISIICARAEELSRLEKHRERYDIAVARAVASLPVLVELCVPFIKTGGIFIAMKGKETEEANNALKKTGAVIDNIAAVRLPCSDYQRNIVIIKKINKTPEKYPRKYSLIKKQPL
jgi:16S rRNA (guanine527-N7)-methyltransferase